MLPIVRKSSVKPAPVSEQRRASQLCRPIWQANLSYVSLLAGISQVKRNRYYRHISGGKLLRVKRVWPVSSRLSKFVCCHTRYLAGSTHGSTITHQGGIR